METREEERLARITELLAAEDDRGLSAFLEKLHPADVAEVMEELDEPERVRLFALLDDGRAALVLQEMDPEAQVPLLRRLDPGRAGRIVREMADDDLADLLGEVRPDEAENLLELMPEAEAADVQELLEYPEDTAGGLMTFEYVALRQDLTAEEAIESLRRQAPDAETAYYVYVVDPDNRLVGVLSLRDLIIAPPSTPISAVMKRDVITVAADTDQEEVARLVAKYNLMALPVVDDQGRLLGIVTVDDVVDVVEEEATEDIMRISAATGQEVGALGIWQRAWRRLPWLLALLFGEMAAGNVIRSFSPTLQTMTFLAAFIPVMAGESGNAATQSLAVVVRGIATGDVDPRELWKIVGREARVGVVSGAVTGLVLALAAILWHGDPALGLVTGLALGLNMAVATVLGSFFPIVIDRMGIDPAVASGPFITTLTDIISMFIYFGLATAFLAYLG